MRLQTSAADAHHQMKYLTVANYQETLALCITEATTYVTKLSEGTIASLILPNAQIRRRVRTDAAATADKPLDMHQLPNVQSSHLRHHQPYMFRADMQAFAESRMDLQKSATYETTLGQELCTQQLRRWLPIRYQQQDIF